jgi:hypothetical protein
MSSKTPTIYVKFTKAEDRWKGALLRAYWRYLGVAAVGLAIYGVGVPILISSRDTFGVLAGFALAVVGGGLFLTYALSFIQREKGK